MINGPAILIILGLAVTNIFLAMTILVLRKHARKLEEMLLQQALQMEQLALSNKEGWETALECEKRIILLAQLRASPPP
jgi:uncharacterized membrane protein